MKRSYLTLAALLLPFLASGATLNYAPTSPRQGDTIIVSLSEKPISLSWGEKTLVVFPYQNSFRALIPLPATTPTGSQTLTATFADSTIEKRAVPIRKANFAIINLPVPEKLNQTPAQLVTNLATQNKAIQAATSKPTEKLYFTSPFGLPLYDNRKVGSPFGEVRKTGDEEIRHLGTDFTAKTGTRVAAINSGVVLKSYLDPIYGESVILDHGYGINTLYLHLNKRYVKEGEPVTKGKIIGTVGTTGYSSAPHLHLSLKVNGVSVDPLRFVQFFK